CRRARLPCARRPVRDSYRRRAWSGSRGTRPRFPTSGAPWCPSSTAYHSAVSHGASSTIRIATYNIHRCRGLDGRTRPDRIATVLRAIDADVVALQEVVGAGPRGSSHAEQLGAALGMGWVMAPARHLRGHQFGNAVLSRFPITHHVEHDLSWKTCEPRRMQRVDVAVHGDGTLHV